MIIRNLKYSFTRFKKNKIYTVLNIAGLSIGFSIVAIIAVFLISEYSKDKNIPNYKNIYRLYNAEQNNVAIDYQLNYKLIEQFPEIDNACAVRTFYGFDIPLTSEKNNINEKKAFLTTNKYFEIFNIHVIKCLTDKPLENYQSAVITQSLAEKLYPGEDVLGKKINLFGFVDFFVNAIIEDFSDKSLNCNFIIHAENPIFKNFGQLGNATMASHYLVMKPGTDIPTLTDKLSRFLSKQKQKIEFAGLQRMEDIYLNSSGIEYNAHEKGNKKMLHVFFIVSFLILLLSIINNTNYELSLQYNNLQNIGIRKSNGAGNSQILGLLFFDNLFKVSCSYILSILTTLLVFPFANQLFEGSLHMSILMEPIFVFFVLLLFVLVVLINSIASIYILSKFDINTFLSKGRLIRTNAIGKNTLTIFQLIISIALLVSIIIVKKQILFIKHRDVGFNKEQLIYTQFPIGVKDEKAKAFKNRINEFSFVKSVSLSNGVPGMINYTGSSNVGNDDKEFNDFEISELLVDADFLRTMGIKLQVGNDFSTSGNNNVCLINETAFKRYGWDNIEGKKFKGWGELDVIGVTSDFNISSLHTLPVPVCLIFGDKRNDYAQINIHFYKGNIAQMLQSIEGVWVSMFSSLPFNFTFYDQFFDSMYKKEEKMGKILGLFSILAFMITCIGILGIAFQNSVTRTKEIGIRKVNGAKVSEILAMLNKDFVKWVVIAFVIATPIAWYAMHKWLENFAYKTTLSWWIFALAGLLALGIALLTVSWQSWKAATKNPVESLRYE